MKKLFTLVLLLTVFPGAVLSASDPAPPRVEITRSDIQTLIGMQSRQITIYGIYLGMSRREAEALLRKSAVLVGFQDEHNPTRVYVYDKTAVGDKGKCVLYLIWEGTEESLKQITVFQDFRKHLPSNFKRLLTMEAIDNASEFKKRFIGYPNRSKVTLDVRMIDLKHTTYYYDDIGLEITHQHHGKDEAVVFGFVIP